VRERKKILFQRNLLFEYSHATTARRGVLMRTRCAVCGKIVVKQELQATDGSVFDSLECMADYDHQYRLRNLRNHVKVMRARVKSRVLEQAELAYREMGGEDWSRVRRLLEILL
jgi:hypothetical protein